MNLQAEVEGLVKTKMGQIKVITLATGNKNKVIEISDLLKDIAINVVPVKEGFDPVENGSTFEENAYIKAYEAAKIMNLPALADDSGLVVDALDGRPGVFSSRYASTDKERIEKLLCELKEIPENRRTARFVCSMILVLPDGKILNSCQGVCEGIISDTQSGTNGFGYDPIFYIPELTKTMAELTLEEKNLISHRSKALKCMIDWFKTADIA